MGRFAINKTNERASDKQTSRNMLSKGQRHGWTHLSHTQPVYMIGISVQSQTMTPYTTGPFSSNKLVP